MATKKGVRHPRLNRLLMAAVPLLTLVHPAHADDVRRPYIVQLADQPVAAYTGSVSGLRATKVAAGQRLDVASTAARQYRSYLGTQQAQAIALLPSAPVTRQYQVVFNGFAARLTDAEVRALKASGKAVRITPDEQQHVVTNYTPTFLGLDQPGGLWEQLGGKEHAGEDVIVGVIDTGIWPENLSYADRVDSNGQPTFDRSGTLAYGAPPARWKGVCQTGEGFSAANCNNKLIGARYFDDGFRASKYPIHWSEFRSPRDSLSPPSGDGGHGTHTSSTAAGNGNVPAMAQDGGKLGVRSGMAPRARLAMYKICWSYNDRGLGPQGVNNTCFNSDSLAAIEAAVADGVDVLNYSISGGESPLDPVEQAFRHAVEAGVFVAAAGGNSGPANAVAHVAPWLATVAASTVDKSPTATIKLGNGQQYSGVSVNPAALPARPIIRGGDAVSAGADASLAAQCMRAEDVGGTRPIAPLDPAKVAGKIVTCQRNSFYSPLLTAEAVKAAGGAGMILLDDGNGTFVDLYSVPTVHVSQADGQAIDAYAAQPNATAALSASELTPVHGPVLADFSSRGPSQFDPGILKPDMAAPGVGVLAAIAPSLTRAQHDAVLAGSGPAYSTSAFMSGTSMATPHVAGLAALLKQRHPGWSPAAVKSALMTSTRALLPTALTGDQDGTLPWGQGAGLVQPNDAADPGLVYDVMPADYQKYLCGLSGESADCALGELKGYALNLASLTLPGVVGKQTITRSVTNVGDKTAIYNASASIDGFDVTVQPATLTLDAGETARYSVTLSRTTAADGVWNFGELVWNDGEHKVRSPLQARYNGGVDAPARVTSGATSGSRQIEVLTGYDGKLSAVRGGLREYTRLAQTVQQAKPGSLESMNAVIGACVARGAGVKAFSIGIPEKTVIARFEISNRDTDGGADDDLDLLVLDQNNHMLAYSGHGGSNESATLIAPPMSVVKVCVLGYKLKNGVSTNYTLSYATAIPNDSKGAVKLSLPDAVQQAGAANVGVSWSGLEQGKRYLGGLQWRDQNGRVLATTELNIDTRDVTPTPSSSARKLSASAQ